MSHVQTSPPDNIYITSTYDGLCFRVSFNPFSTWEGISGVNVYESSSELGSQTKVAYITAPGLTAYRTPSRLFRPYSGGGKLTPFWFYRLSTISCYGESALSRPFTVIDEESLQTVQSVNGTSWASLF